MKKIIFILLLAQTISFIIADSGCRAYGWRMGSSLEHVECYCNCNQYPNDTYNRGECMMCGHFRTPVSMDSKIKDATKKQAVAIKIARIKKMPAENATDFDYLDEEFN